MFVPVVGVLSLLVSLRHSVGSLTVLSRSRSLRLHSTADSNSPRKAEAKTSVMSTPDTVGTINRISMPFNYPVLAVSRTVERQTTPSTVRLSYGGSIATWTSEDDDEGDQEVLPTFEACSCAIMAAAERMVALTREPHSLAVAIAYDECLDIVTAAVDHMEQIGSQGVQSEEVLEAYRAMRSIQELLRPSPPVRRALQF